MKHRRVRIGGVVRTVDVVGVEEEEVAIVRWQAGEKVPSASQGGPQTALIKINDTEL